MNAAEVAAKIGQGREKFARGKWSLPCPAHDDHRPSLDISEGTDGRVLMICRVGCEKEAVLIAAGLDWSDLFSDESRNGPREPDDTWSPAGPVIAIYPYIDSAGNLIAEKVRVKGKKFLWRHPDPTAKGGWDWHRGDAPCPLYRLPEVLKAIESGRTIVVVEGEADADRLHSLGIVATTNPDGAKKWRPEDTETLRDAIAAVVPDRDEIGYEHAATVAGSLDGVAQSVQFLDLDERSKKKGADVSDWLDAGGPPEELKRLIAEAPVWVPSVEKIVNESPATPTVGISWEPTDLGPVLRGERITPAPTVLARTDGVLLFYPTCLNVLLGETESCKTWVALIAIEQELNRDRHVILVDFEGSPESIVERLKELGISDQQINEQFSYIQPDGMFNELAQALVEDAIAERGAPSLVIIDGITEAMSQAGLNPDVGVDVVKFYDSAPRWFARHGSAVVMIDHVTKNKDTRNGYAIGSERKKSGIDGAAYQIDLVSPFGRGKVGRVTLTVSKDRGGYIRQHTSNANVIAFVELRSLDGSITTAITAPVASGSVPFVPTGIMGKLSKMIEASPDGIGVRQLRLAVNGKNDAKDAALEILINEGYVEVKPGPNRSKIHTSLKPYPPVYEGSDDEIF